MDAQQVGGPVWWARCRPGNGTWHLYPSREPMHPQSDGLCADHALELAALQSSFMDVYEYSCMVRELKGIQAKERADGEILETVFSAPLV